MALGIVFLVHVILQAYIPSFLVVNPQLQNVATQALVNLDASTKLSQYLSTGSTGDWGPMTTALKASLPSSVAFQLTVYDCSGGCTTPMYGTPIRSGIIQGSIATVTYVEQVSDASGSVTVYKLVLTVAA